MSLFLRLIFLLFAGEPNQLYGQVTTYTLYWIFIFIRRTGRDLSLHKLLLADAVLLNCDILSLFLHMLPHNSIVWLRELLIIAKYSLFSILFYHAIQFVRQQWTWQRWGLESTKVQMFSLVLKPHFCQTHVSGSLLFRWVILFISTRQIYQLSCYKAGFFAR